MTDNLAVLITVWIVVVLALYRVQRIVTADKWPPSVWLRERIGERTGKQSGWSEFIHCAWCYGGYSTVVFATLTHIHVADLLDGTLHRPAVFLVYVVVAFTTIVGKLGTND